MRLQPFEASRFGAHQWWLQLVTASVGLVLLVWLIAHAGPVRLWGQLRALGSLLPLILALTGLRYVLQAGSWRLAIARPERPGWAAAISGIVAGEGAGYLLWAGPIAREPIKTWYVRHRTPAPIALAAALAERTAYAVAAGLLVGVAASLVLWRLARAGVVGMGVAVLLVAWTVTRLRRSPRMSGAAQPSSTSPTRGASACSRLGSRVGPWCTGLVAVFGELWRRRRRALAAMLALALIQQALLLLEASVILSGLGAAPSLSTIAILEGGTKLVNAVGAFVPGRVGIYEAATALLADTLRLGTTHGVSLALARRTRALIWGVAGLVLVGMRLLGRSGPQGRRRPAVSLAEAT